LSGSFAPRLNSPVPDRIERAPSGRARCRGCGATIAKGELRFGESLPNAYAEGEALYWFHLHCAACMRPEKAGPALDAHPDELPEREAYRRWVALGTAHHRVPRIVRAERASSGRARCRHCREPIEKDGFRIALQMMEETRMTPIGFIHVACAGGYFGTTDVLDRLVRFTPDLAAGDEAELARLLASGAGAPGPGLAKAGTEAPPAESTEKKAAR
jgi:hypothetical protein